jgi:ABC-2 type transport system permease protein
MELSIVKNVVGAHMQALTQADTPPPPPAFESRDESTAGKTNSWNGAAHSLAGMGVQFILMASIEAAVAILTDRQRGLWKRLQAAPLSRATLLGSRILSGAIIALLIVVWLFTFGALTMGVRIGGAPIGFAAVAVSFALMASTLGVMISTLGKTPQATRSVGIFVVLIAVMLGGAWFPSFLFPSWMQKLTLIMPTRWAVDGLDAMTWRGLGLADALPAAGVLLASAVVFGTIAVLRFRWEE